ncbi:MAG: 4-hydroxy-tetrahydrodipicolinate synthase [Planctomycetes bacterium]|nr:4-hydroxy-tetrahydrodipicolinate synthase [Planctomycetota bacterium]
MRNPPSPTRQTVFWAGLTSVERVAGRVPVIAGTGSNNTADTVKRTKRAQATGADAALVVVPSYNRPTPEGLFRHFATIADAVELPIVLYNVPTRTGVDMGNDVVARLREAHANIVAIKDAGGDVDRVTDLASRCDIVVLSGDDSLTWPLMALGAAGVISVLSNLTPSLMKSLVTAAEAGEVTSVLPLHRKVYDLAVGLGRFGPNPIPIKTAMAVSGLVREEFRLPLCPVDKSARPGIEAVLRRHELLERTNS